MSRPRQPLEPGECQHNMNPAWCAECQQLASVADPYEDVLIERFITARYDGTCALVPAHRLVAGTTIGRAVDADNGEKVFGWCCALCVEKITGGEE